MSSEIVYVCDNCGHEMVVSVEKVRQVHDEYRECEICGAQVAWAEFTV